MATVASSVPIVSSSFLPRRQAVASVRRAAPTPRAVPRPSRASRSSGQTILGPAEASRVLCKAAEAEPETGGTGLVEKLTGEELEVVIAERDRPLIIDFYATWCGPCVLMAKELEQVAKELGDKVRIVKVDTDENPDISTALQIQGLPTIVFVGMDPSKPALRAEGLIPAATVKEIIETEL